MTRTDLTDAYTARGGGLSGAALEQAAAIAWGHLMQQTMGRVQHCGPELEEAVSDCFSLLVDAIHDDTVHGGVTRETVGDWSRSYENGTPPEARYSAIIRRQLGETGLLYRGWPQ